MVLITRLPDWGSGQKPYDSVQSESVLVTHLIDNQIYIIMALFKHLYA